jgi:hypothetical protein
MTRRSMRSPRAAAAAGALLASLLTAAGAVAAVPAAARCAAAGDPYSPSYRNGGDEVQRYDLGIGDNPASGVVQGRARILARPRRA